MAETQEFDALIIAAAPPARESPATAPCAGYAWR